jgi:monoamine oxidase
LSREDRIRFALRDVETLHGGQAGCYEERLVGGMSHSWAQDEYTFGAFALFDPHQETELFDAMWTPHKKVHFAGEHTSLKHGWIEGAVESGIRAAWEIHQEVTNQ